jgi:hypothetical protein
MEIYGKNFVRFTWDDEVVCRVSQKESSSFGKGGVGPSLDRMYTARFLRDIILDNTFLSDIII